MTGNKMLRIMKIFLRSSGYKDILSKGIPNRSEFKLVKFKSPDFNFLPVSALFFAYGLYAAHFLELNTAGLTTWPYR